jgi:hypothetical protein
MRTPVKSSESVSPSSSDAFFLPLRDLEVFAFLAGLDDEDWGKICKSTVGVGSIPNIE